MPRDRSSTRAYGSYHSSPRSRTTASQYHWTSRVERASSSSNDPIPCRSMKPRNRLRSIYARLGRQTISGEPSWATGGSNGGSGMDLLIRRDAEDAEDHIMDSASSASLR